jgi:hypothetical protein
MHIELAPKYEPGINSLIRNLKLGAHITNSFNASGETIILVANKDELEKILQASEGDFTSAAADETERSLSPALLEGLKAIIHDHLNNRI